MNLLRKSSMILLGAATAGLLAFACADNSDGASGDTQDISAAPAKALLISQVYGGGGGSHGLDGDFVELFNPTGDTVKLDGMALQTASAEHKFDETKVLALSGAVESGHYFLVSLTTKATFGFADPKKADLIATTADFSLNTTSGSVVLLKDATKMCGSTDGDDGTSCAAKAVSLVGYGPLATALQAPAKAPKNATEAILRVDHGCTDHGSNLLDFTTGAPTPRTSMDDGFDCSKIASEPDAGADAATADAASSDSGSDAGDAGKPPKTPKDGGTTTKTDAGASTDDGSDDGSDDGTPAPTTGKKKTTSANTPPQPIASSSPSCSTTSGPASAGGFAGLAGLGLALAALGRRKNRNT